MNTATGSRSPSNSTYNRLSNQQIPHAHNRIRSLIESALATSFALRGANPAMIDVEDLELPLGEMDDQHA